MINDPISTIWIEAEEWTEGQWDSKDANSDIIVTFENGDKWVATFFTYQNIKSLVEKNKVSGECLAGKYLWAADMLLVDELSRDCVETIIKHLIEEDDGGFEVVFDRMETDI